MDKSVNERIKEIRQALKINQRDFAKGIYISQSLYAAIEVGGRKVNNRHIALIVNKYKANKEWILTGKGPMFLESLPDVKLELLTEIFNELNQPFQDYLLLQANELLKIQKNDKPNL
jgi:transcriptional regulator with XRE-family HTH domain